MTSAAACWVGIDLGSTTTKAVVIDEDAVVIGRGITNSRSNYDLACEIARSEAFVDAQMNRFRAALAVEPSLRERVELAGGAIDLSRGMGVTKLSISLPVEGRRA